MQRLFCDLHSAVVYPVVCRLARIVSCVNWRALCRVLPAVCQLACIVSCVASGVPAVVDFAAMRDAMSRLGGDPEKINPVCPADLVIDHSVQADLTRR